MRQKPTHPKGQTEQLPAVPQQPGTSYLRKYRHQAKKSNLSQPQQSKQSGGSHAASDYKALQTEIDRELKDVMDSGRDQEKNDIRIEEQNNEEQLIYEEFLEMERHYNQQFSQLQEAIAIVEEECDTEKQKVKEMEKNLKTKKKELHDVRTQYETSIRTSAESQNDNSDQVAALEAKVKKMKSQHTLQLTGLQKQVKALEDENNELAIQLQGLDELIQPEGGSLSSQQYQITVKQLDVEQQKLREQIIQLEQESNKLRADIQKITSIKAINPALHIKYLDLYEKVVIHQSISKAEEMIKAYKGEKDKLNALAIKKSEIFSKKEEVKMKEQALDQKNLIIEELSQQIRDKSTMLLNIYQDSQQ